MIFGRAAKYNISYARRFPHRLCQPKQISRRIGCPAQPRFARPSCGGTACRGRSDFRANPLNHRRNTHRCVRGSAAWSLGHPDQSRLGGRAAAGDHRPARGVPLLRSPDGTFTLKASLSGFQTIERRDVHVLFGTTVTLDLALKVGGLQDEIVVSARAPAVDVKTAQSTSKVESTLIHGAPIVASQRDSDDAIPEINPGFNFRTAFGGARSANEVLFDGSRPPSPSVRDQRHRRQSRLDRGTPDRESRRKRRVRRVHRHRGELHHAERQQRLPWIVRVPWCPAVMDRQQSRQPAFEPADEIQARARVEPVGHRHAGRWSRLPQSHVLLCGLPVLETGDAGLGEPDAFGDDRVQSHRQADLGGDEVHQNRRDRPAKQHRPEARRGGNGDCRSRHEQSRAPDRVDVQPYLGSEPEDRGGNPHRRIVLSTDGQPEDRRTDRTARAYRRHHRHRIGQRRDLSVSRRRPHESRRERAALRRRSPGTPPPEAGAHRSTSTR